MSLPVAISYSGGASSEWLVEAMLRGVLPRPEHVCVVFADTGSEHEWTYEAVARVEERCRGAGVEFLRCGGGNLGEDLLEIPNMRDNSRADHPPFWVATPGGRGKIQHRCTREYKVAPIRREVRRWLLRHGLPLACESWVGFSADEAGRAQRALIKRESPIWNPLRFPAIDLGVPRVQQRAAVKTWTGRLPHFSMCVFCPFKTPQRWHDTRGLDLAKAYVVDEAIRDLRAVGVDNPAFLTDRLVPVRQLIERGDPQPNLPGFESTCDAGACFL